MHMKILFAPFGKEDYEYWQKKDPKKIKRIKKLLDAIKENPFEGIGKPELLRHEYTGYWSRRIDKTHRLVYAVEDEKIVVISCRHHY